MLPDLVGGASRRVANTQAKYAYWIIGVAGGTPAVGTLLTNPQHRWAILGVEVVVAVWFCRYLVPISVRLGPGTMVVHWPLRSVTVDADSLRMASHSPALGGLDRIAFRVRRAAWFNLVLNQYEDPREMLATIIRIVEAAPSFSGDRERELSRIRKLA